MYSAPKLAKKYINYWLKASNGKGHGIHSPFVYDFVQNVLNSRLPKEKYAPIEQQRQLLKNDNRILTLQDFGAGSVIENSKQRSVTSIAKNSLKSEKYAQLIHKIVRYYQPETILELGTCLGITTAYLAKVGNNKVTTMEGADEVAEVAASVFQHLDLQNIEIIKGNFDNTLPEWINKQKEANKKLDFAFIDGNHREEPTVNYFDALLPLIHNDSVMIFDDVHWSEGMENAWSRIINHSSVTLSIDLFFIGIVFFKKEFKQKQHFTIRY